jgi:nucleoside-diphosphate-sugar epimerase
MDLPGIVVTGASGFLGRHLLEAIKEDYRVYGIARRSQVTCGAPVHPNIVWYQADIGNRPCVVDAFEDISRRGGADIVVHLAAHYDFSGEEHPEYWRTNVHGLRNVLDLTATLSPRKVIFSSSVAACKFPPEGQALTEDSPADGEHIYAVTKRTGEEMLSEYRDQFPSTIVRFAALFSDWCEYPPLFMFLGTWLSKAWNSRVLGGRGLSAIPYLHVRDAVAFLSRLFDHLDDFGHGDVLICSTDGAVSHRELFEAATDYWFGEKRKPIFMPKLLCGPGIRFTNLVGMLTGERPFERPWMAQYIDKQLTVNAHKTRVRLGWMPRERLKILRRLPFLLDNYKTEPIEWYRRNRAAMKEARLAAHLRVYRLLERHEQEISAEVSKRLRAPEARRRFPSYQQLGSEDMRWNHRVALRHLMNAAMTRQKTVFVSYCRDLAERRFESGFDQNEVCAALTVLGDAAYHVVRQDPEAEELEGALHHYITMTVRFGCDQAQDVYELKRSQLEHQRVWQARQEAGS